MEKDIHHFKSKRREILNRLLETITQACKIYCFSPELSIFTLKYWRNAQYYHSVAPFPVYYNPFEFWEYFRDYMFDE